MPGSRPSGLSRRHRHAGLAPPRLPVHGLMELHGRPVCRATAAAYSLACLSVGAMTVRGRAVAGIQVTLRAGIKVSGRPPHLLRPRNHPRAATLETTETQFARRDVHQLGLSPGLDQAPPVRLLPLHWSEKCICFCFATIYAFFEIQKCVSKPATTRQGEEPVERLVRKPPDRDGRILTGQESQDCSARRLDLRRVGLNAYPVGLAPVTRGHGTAPPRHLDETQAAGADRLQARVIAQRRDVGRRGLSASSFQL